MADTFFNPTPAVPQTNDKWSRPDPTNDRWAWIQEEFNRDIAWHIQNAWDAVTSWYIQNSTEPGVAWHIQNVTDDDISWHIQNGFMQDIAWNIFEQIVKYLAMFRIKPLTSTYRMLALTSAFDFQKLQSDYTLLANLISNYDFAFTPQTNFNVDPVLPETFDIDEQPQTDRKIQPAPAGEERPYE